MFPTPTSIVSAMILLVSKSLLASSMPSIQPHRLLDTSDGPEYTYRRTSDGTEPYGPSEWHLGYEDCNGTSQSPINLSAAEEQMQSFFTIFYPATCDSSQLIFSQENHFFMVSLEDCDEVPSIVFQEHEYEVLQVHIHSTSEHTIGSAHHDGEIHIVHTRVDSNDELLVIGVLMDASGHGGNMEIDQLWEVLVPGAESAEDVDANFMTDIYGLLPATPSFVHYMGSLTTPPCTEDVSWIVMTEPILISELRLEEYRNIVAGLENSKVDEFGNTNRPTQPINGRPLYFFD